MRFLLDANLSPRLVTGLVEAGYAVRHVDEIGLLGASDVAIFDRAAEDGDVVITADSDFSMLLAARGSARPSVVLLHRWRSCSGPSTRGFSSRTCPRYWRTCKPVRSSPSARRASRFGACRSSVEAADHRHNRRY